MFVLGQVVRVVSGLVEGARPFELFVLVSSKSVSFVIVVPMVILLSLKMVLSLVEALLFVKETIVVRVVLLEFASQAVHLIILSVVVAIVRL